MALSCCGMWNLLSVLKHSFRLSPNSVFSLLRWRIHRTFSVGVRVLDMLLFPYHIRGNRFFLKGTARYDYQSTYCKKLAEFSTD